MADNKNILPHQSSLPPSGSGQNGFSTPNNYFDELPADIMERIQSKKKPVFILNPSLTIASMAVLSGIILLLVFIKEESLPAEIQLSDNDIEHVVQNPESYDLDAASIADQYLALNISDEPLNSESAVSDDEIKNYLEENSQTTDIKNEY